MPRRDFDEAIRRMRLMKARSDRRRRELQAAEPTREERIGSSFRAGDIVRDRVTGKRGRVARATVRPIVIPSSGEERS